MTAWTGAEPTVAVDPRDGVDLLIELADAGDDPLTVVAVGPLTNVATALARAPHIRGRIERISIMGGAIGLGNWTPAAEFNVYADPEAAEAVLGSGVPITLVPLEVTHLALATDAVLDEILALGSPVARMTVGLMRFFADTYDRVFDFPSPPVHDPCAVAAVIDPALVPTRPMNVAVETASALTAGRTICDVYGMSGRGANAEVGVGLDVDGFWRLMIGALATYGTPSAEEPAKAPLGG